MKVRIVEAARSFEASLPPLLELGRQEGNEPGPYSLMTKDGEPARLIIAWNPEVAEFSRQHLELRRLPGDRVRVTNLSKRFQVPLGGGNLPLLPGGTLELTPPFTLLLKGRTVTVGDPRADSQGLLRLAEQTWMPGQRVTLMPGPQALPALSDPQHEQLVAWLQTTMGVLQGAVGSADFQARAAEALVDIVGLHSGRVLRFHEGRWETVLAHGAGNDHEASWQPSDTVLDAVLRERRTVWQRPSQADVPAPSLTGLHTVVAAPLRDASGGVVGALYGELSRGGAASGREAGRLEAVLVELLACGVSAGLARLRHEEERARNQTLFEQFFTAPLAARLLESPDLLRGRTETVTVLFCDVRGSCGVSGRLGPVVTEQWIGDVLNSLSRCVLAEDGVLVDYIGDEIMAMWGAPTPQPDQTERAARAALAMLDALASLNARWRETLKEEMGLGIGINRGPAQVGNVGSSCKFKYGALGDTVNVGSRTQGLTKYLKCRLLVTAEARVHLGPEFAARRVCQARLVNIEQPIHFYEVGPGDTQRASFFAASERALDALELHSQFAQAGRQASTLLEQCPGDGPLLLTLARATDALMRDGQGVDPVWSPPGK